MGRVAQLVRAPGCGSGGCEFEPHRAPASSIYKINDKMFFTIYKTTNIVE